jgi:hypothetical protein
MSVTLLIYVLNLTESTEPSYTLLLARVELIWLDFTHNCGKASKLSSQTIRLLKFMDKYGTKLEYAMGSFPRMWGDFISSPDKPASIPTQIDIPIRYVVEGSVLTHSDGSLDTSFSSTHACHLPAALHMQRGRQSDQPFISVWTSTLTHYPVSFFGGLAATSQEL